MEFINQLLAHQLTVGEVLGLGCCLGCGLIPVTAVAWFVGTLRSQLRSG